MKLAGQDFLYDLMGIIDLLWPLVLLQLRGQSLMCPGWKIYGWIAQALKQLKEFSKENSINICLKKKYGKATLENGWYLIGEENPLNSNVIENQMEQEKDDSQAAQSDDNDVSDNEDDDEDNNDPLQKNAPRYIWKMREVNGCRTELADFAIALQTTLYWTIQEYAKTKRFDGVSGNKTSEEKCPVDRNEYAQLGAASFEKYICFVSSLPHVKKVIKDDEQQLGPAFSQQLFWRIKSILIDVMT